MFFFFNDTATTEIYTLSLHDALPISADRARAGGAARGRDRREGGVPLGPAEAVRPAGPARPAVRDGARRHGHRHARSEEHTSELQSRQYLVCRLLLEKKKNTLPGPTT